MTTFHPRDKRGYVAIVSILMIMAVFLVITSAVALSSFLVRSNAGSGYYKEISRALAESCVHTALLRLSEDAAYAGSESVIVATSSAATESCYIVGVSASGTERIITVSAEFQDARTNLRITADPELNISGWEEQASF